MQESVLPNFWSIRDGRSDQHSGNSGRPFGQLAGLLSGAEAVLAKYLAVVLALLIGAVLALQIGAVCRRRSGAIQALFGPGTRLARRSLPIFENTV